jgi:hypothetical protein
MNLGLLSALFMTFSIATCSSSRAEDMVGNTEGSAKTVVTSGLYQAYGIVDKLQVSAAMLSNPSRLKSVDFGVVYYPANTAVKPDDLTKVLDALAQGNAAFAQKTGSSFLVKTDARGHTPWDTGELQCSSKNLSTEERGTCLTLMNLWLKGADSNKFAIVSTDDKLLTDTVANTVINWSGSNLSTMPEPKN